MLRGLDTRNAPDDDPVMVKVADRTDISGELAVYVRENPPAYVRDRQQAVLDVVEMLRTAGALRSVSIVEWPERAGYPADDAAAIYDEFAEVVGPRSLEPFFQRKPATGGADYVVDLPVICVALRAEDELRGLYPCWRNGTHHSIEDATTALSLGESLANLDDD